MVVVVVVTNLIVRNMNAKVTVKTILMIHVRFHFGDTKMARYSAIETQGPRTIDPGQRQ